MGWIKRWVDWVAIAIPIILERQKYIHKKDCDHCGKKSKLAIKMLKMELFFWRGREWHVPMIL